MILFHDTTLIRFRGCVHTTIPYTLNWIHYYYYFTEKRLLYNEFVYIHIYNVRAYYMSV